MSTASSASLEQLAAEVKQYKVGMKLAIDLIRTQMTQVTALVDDVESRGRRKFLLFRGIEEKEGESLKEVITKNTLKIGDFSPESIRFCYRLGKDSAQGGSRPILVRFHSLDIRSSIWRSKKDFKGTGVSVAEYLTATRRSFFNEGRRNYGVAGHRMEAFIY
ncbi:Uncharacterized protein OBRU01_25155 [Operophtera brumata]|uniref:Uncharacterized protein n=1 Tax=Operophtera brumata TaxID=104452 RepID=A0A0L7KF72_OPEBR|nr:Uncharacterized protein OBRU01_25155 [Operophtera brumata]